MNWDYIACFIDTDGCVGIKKTGLVYIDFSNTNREVLEKIQKFIRCGCLSVCIKGSKTSFQKKTVYKLTLGNQTYCLALLTHVVDRMIIKQKKGKKCLAFLRERIKTMVRIPKCKSGFCWCSHCHRWLKRNKFATRKQRGLNVPTAYCRDCQTKLNKRWRKNHPHYDIELRKRKLKELERKFTE